MSPPGETESFPKDVESIDTVNSQQWASGNLYSQTHTTYMYKL